METAGGIESNLTRLRQRIDAAAGRTGRSGGEVMLLAVSKTMPPEPVKEAYLAGQRHFGENRVQEARDKAPHLPDDITWHLIGHLQSNKAKYCPGLFHWIHSIDSVSLAREVARRYREGGMSCKTLVQVSVSGEEAKFGCRPGETADILTALLEEEGTEPVGLMTMPPFTADPEEARPHFAALRQLRDRLLSGGCPPASLRELSMGMTGDFETAVEEGATIVRVGTAVFGPRGLQPTGHQEDV